MLLQKKKNKYWTKRDIAEGVRENWSREARIIFSPCVLEEQYSPKNSKGKL